jgi:hypothetical protein
MSDDIRWIRSYVLEEEDGAVGTVCIYQASSPEAIREHASRADLPADELTPADGPADAHGAQRGDDQGHDRQSGPDHADDGEHHADDADNPGNTAGDDQSVGPLLPDAAGRIASTLLDIGHMCERIGRGNAHPLL